MTTDASDQEEELLVLQSVYESSVVLEEPVSNEGGSNLIALSIVVTLDLGSSVLVCDPRVLPEIAVDAAAGPLLADDDTGRRLIGVDPRALADERLTAQPVL